MTYTTRTPTGIRNVHCRVTRGPLSAASSLLESLGSDDDQLWPGDRWPAIELDRGLAVGSRGGHGPIRYHVEDVEPGRSVTFRFDDGQPITGTHSLAVDPVDGDRVRWTHELMVEDPSPVLTAAVVPLHDAVLEDLLDQAESSQSGAPLVRRPLGRRVRACLAIERVLDRTNPSTSLRGAGLWRGELQACSACSLRSTWRGVWVRRGRSGAGMRSPAQCLARRVPARCPDWRRAAPSPARSGQRVASSCPGCRRQGGRASRPE